MCPLYRLLQHSYFAWGCFPKKWHEPPICLDIYVGGELIGQTSANR